LGEALLDFSEINDLRVWLVSNSPSISGN
ncbi:MAG: DUF4351 domain-containing protein, partial [Limnospira sp. PMC 894.15]